MSRFAKQVATALARVGFIDAASKVFTHRSLIEGQVGPQARIGGKLFSLSSKDSLTRLAETVMQTQVSRPDHKATLARAPATAGMRVMTQDSRAEKARLDQAVTELTSAIAERIAPYQHNPWFALTAPYRLWHKALTDTKAMLEKLHLRPNASARQVGEGLLQEAGFDDTYRVSMEVLNGLQRLDVVCDLWAMLKSRASPHAKQSLEVLASVGACPPSTRTEAVRHSLPTLISTLLVAELEQSDAHVVLKTLFGTRRHIRDREILEQVCRTAKEDLSERAAGLMRTLLHSWTAEPDALHAATPVTVDAWGGLLHMKGHDVLVPDEVMRSLLEAALRNGREQQLYALPEVEYWVKVPDRLLMSMGIDRFRFVQHSPRSALVICAPTRITFPLDPPPIHVRGSALYIAMMAVIAHAEMVTRRDRLFGERGGLTHVLQLPSQRQTGPAATQRAIRVGRGLSRTSTAGRARTGTSANVRAVSYVVPHLRLLAVGGASAIALTEAAQHGIRIPDGYTFVRGHFRGDGPSNGKTEYSIVDVALETVRRFQSRAGLRR